MNKVVPVNCIRGALYGLARKVQQIARLSNIPDWFAGTKRIETPVIAELLPSPHCTAIRARLEAASRRGLKQGQGDRG